MCAATNDSIDGRHGNRRTIKLRCPVCKKTTIGERELEGKNEARWIRHPMEMIVIDLLPAVPY